MNGDETRSVPLLGEISLEYVQQIQHHLDGGFISTPIANLPGELQQRTGRPSHRIHITGLLIGDEAADQLQSLQTATASGENVTFASDITTALDLQRVVITYFRAVELAGHPSRFWYQIQLTESPPLPPPATVDPFGGLGDFGLGDLGFDTDILGDLQDLAGDVAGAVSDAMDVIDQIGALANLDGLSLGGLLEPMNGAVNEVGSVASSFRSAIDGLVSAFY